MTDGIPQTKLEDQTQHPGEHEKHENCPKHGPRPRRSIGAAVEAAVPTTMTSTNGRKLCTIALRCASPVSAIIIAFADQRD